MRAQDHRLARVQQGDACKLGRLLDAYRRYLSAIAERQLDKKLRTRVDVSDVVQETMFEAHRDFVQFRGKCEREFVAWIRRILANNIARAIRMHVLTKMRDVRRDVSLGDVSDSPKELGARQSSVLATNAASPSHLAELREQAAILADTMCRLSDDQRTVLLLRNMQGLSFREVAERMDRTVPAAKMLWMRSIRRIRGLYEERDAA